MGIQRASTPAVSGSGIASPITSARPLRGRVQRAPLALDRSKAPSAADEPAGSGTSSSLPTSGGAVTVHRGAEAGELSSALDARSFTHGGEIYLPSSHGPMSSGPAKHLLAHELTHVVQQRRLGSSLPSETSEAGRSLEAEAAAAERTASMPLAVQPDRHQRAEPATSSSATATSASSSAGSGLPAMPGPAGSGMAATPAAAETATVRLASEAQRSPASRGAMAATGGAASAAGAAGRAKPSERELEDLARQLYDRIGRRLRRDLLVERERSGMAMDLP